MPRASLALAGVGAVACAAIIVLAYREHAALVRRVEELSAEASRAEAGLSVERQAASAFRGAMEDQARAIVELRGDLERLGRAQAEAQAETRRLNDVFADHDLRSLARARAGLVERRVNAGTARVFRLLECASGPGGDACGQGGAGGEAPAPGAEAGATAPGALDGGDAGQAPLHF